MSAAATAAALSALMGCAAIAELLGHRVARTPRRAGSHFARRRASGRSITARLAAAGGLAGLGQREWLTAKSLGAVAGCALGLVFGAGAPGRTAILLIPGGAVAGFVAPDLWLARWTRRRARAALRELPDMIDLLRVTVEAGLPPARALATVGGEFSGPLAQEWRRVSTEIMLGLPHDQAVMGMARSIDAEEVRVLAEALRRSRRHGAPLGRVLAGQATRARHAQRQRVREQAARAGPKIQLVVALLLVPSVLLLVAAGLLSELQRSGLGLPT